jgi:hypothetical protein
MAPEPYERAADRAANRLHKQNFLVGKQHLIIVQALLILGHLRVIAAIFQLKPNIASVRLHKSAPSVYPFFRESSMLLMRTRNSLSITGKEPPSADPDYRVIKSAEEINSFFVTTI